MKVLLVDGDDAHHRTGWACGPARERFKNQGCGTRTTSRNFMTRHSL